MPSFKGFHMDYLMPPMPVTELIDFNEIENYERESQLNNPSAQTKLALIFYIGSDKIKKDIKKSIELFEKAASLKYMNAEICLGIIYYCGIGTDVNIEKAATLLDKAAEKGDSDAQLVLGLIYLKQGNKKGLYLIRSAAEQGNYFAQFDLGICYSKGEFINIDFERVFDWYSRSAQNGCADAMYNLGIIYQTGIREEDEEVEEEYGDNDGIFYLVEKNINISYRCYRRAASLNHRDAMFNLSILLLENDINVDEYEKMDIETRKSIRAKESLIYLEKAAGNGCKDALFTLGLLYECGSSYNEENDDIDAVIYIHKDTKKAIEYYTKAAELGHMHAKNKLGIISS